MEGIRDGRALDDCFVCALLWPGLTDCPRCGHAMSWSPASLRDPDDARAELVAAMTAWRQGDGLDELEQLLAMIHGLPERLRAEVEPELPSLRAAWLRLAPLPLVAAVLDASDTRDG